MERQKCGTPEKSRTRRGGRPPAVDMRAGNENDEPISGNGRDDCGQRRRGNEPGRDPGHRDGGELQPTALARPRQHLLVNTSESPASLAILTTRGLRDAARQPDRDSVAGKHFRKSRQLAILTTRERPKGPRAAQYIANMELYNGQHRETPFGVKGGGKRPDNGLRKPRQWGCIPTGSTTLR